MLTGTPFLSPDISDVIGILDLALRGDSNAASQLLLLVYEKLRRLAAAGIAQEKPGQTLQATALVHEAWLRWAGRSSSSWKHTDLEKFLRTAVIWNQ